MKTKTIVLLAGGICLLTALIIAAFVLPAGQAKETITQSVQTQTEQTAQIAPEATTAPEPHAGTITFPAADGLTVTALLYWNGNSDAPMILLFHQAENSSAEYLDIAPKLTAQGYNCLAVDQRSGGSNAGIENRTYQAAKEKNLPTGYTDAYPDLEAALTYAEQELQAKQIIVWGSSYSASLALILAAQHPDEISAVLAFSPGEYFKLDGKQVADYAKDITQPAFITSTDWEVKAWQGIADQIKSEGSVFFVPKGKGWHGSASLDRDAPSPEEYWTAVNAFLASLNTANSK